MQIAYTMTDHAIERMRMRRINPLDAIKAIEAGKMHARADGTAHFFDPKTRIKVIVNPTERTVITVYKAVKQR